MTACRDCGDNLNCVGGCSPTDEFITAMRAAADTITALSKMHDALIVDRYPWSAWAIRTEADYLERNR